MLFLRCLLFIACALANATPARADMSVTIPNLAPNATFGPAQIADSYGCRGKNRAPVVVWSGVPRRAAQLALTMVDLDTPVGLFVHWTLLGIEPTSADSAAALRSHAFSGLNDLGRKSYQGPCPAPGDPPHEYVLTLYAFDTRLPVDASTTHQLLRFLARGHVLSEASTVARR